MHPWVACVNSIRAEVLWTLHFVDRHYSYKSQEENNQLFERMFPDSDIAKNYSCTETKTRYSTTFGLAPYMRSLNPQTGRATLAKLAHMARTV